MNRKNNSAHTDGIGGKIFSLEYKERPTKTCFGWPFVIFTIKKLRDPFLPQLTEVETPQVTTAKLPYGTRKHPLRAATFLS